MIVFAMLCAAVAAMEICVARFFFALIMAAWPLAVLLKHLILWTHLITGGLGYFLALIRGSNALNKETRTKDEVGLGIVFPLYPGAVATGLFTASTILYVWAAHDWVTYGGGWIVATVIYGSVGALMFLVLFFLKGNGADKVMNPAMTSNASQGLQEMVAQKYGSRK